MKVSRLCCGIKCVDKAHARNTSSNDSLTRVSWMHVVGLQKGPSKLILDVQSHVINNSVSDSEKSLTHTCLMIVNMTETEKRRNNLGIRLFRNTRQLHEHGNSHDDLVSYEILDGKLLYATVTFALRPRRYPDCAVM